MEPDRELSETELEAYNEIKKAGKEGIPIIELSHKFQGAVGKLLSKKLIEKFRQKYTWEYTIKWSGKKGIHHRMTNWVRIKK